MIHFKKTAEPPSNLIEEVRQAATADVKRHLAEYPIDGIAWDLAERIGKNNGWDWCKSSVSGKGWAIMVLMLDKLTKRVES